MMNSEKPGSSHIQREAEEFLISEFSRQRGIHLKKEARFSAKVDGLSDNPRILCEVWAHIGKPKGAQPHKIANDALKLLFLDKKLGGGYDKIILFTDKEARLPFISQKWIADCLREYDIKTKVIELPTELRSRIIEAQKRQKR